MEFAFVDVLQDNKVLRKSSEHSDKVFSTILKQFCTYQPSLEDSELLKCVNKSLQPYIVEHLQNLDAFTRNQRAQELVSKLFQ